MTELEPPEGPAELGQLEARGVRQDRGALASDEALEVEARRGTQMRERSANFASFLAFGVDADESLSEEETRARLVLAGFRELSADDASVLHEARGSVTLSELEQGELKLHLDTYGIPRHELVFSGRSVSWHELTLDADELPVSSDLHAPRRAPAVSRAESAGNGEASGV